MYRNGKRPDVIHTHDWQTALAPVVDPKAKPVPTQQQPLTGPIAAPRSTTISIRSAISSRFDDENGPCSRAVDHEGEVLGRMKAVVDLPFGDFRDMEGTEAVGFSQVGWPSTIPEQITARAGA